MILFDKKVHLKYIYHVLNGHDYRANFIIEILEVNWNWLGIANLTTKSTTGQLEVILKYEFYKML